MSVQRLLLSLSGVDGGTVAAVIAVAALVIERNNSSQNRVAASADLRLLLLLSFEIKLRAVGVLLRRDNSRGFIIRYIYFFFVNY